MKNVKQNIKLKKVVDIEIWKCYIIWATAGKAIEMIFEN